jgi:hypothetical protein
MESLMDILDPSTATGAVVVNVVGGIGVIVVLALAAWLGGPLRWWIQERRLRQILLNGRSFLFVFDPMHGRSKTITFLDNGEVGEGRNSNEHTWRIRKGALDILAADGQLYSRFTQDRASGRLVHTNDPDTRSIHGQFMAPHFVAWRREADGGASASTAPGSGR